MDFENWLSEWQTLISNQSNTDIKQYQSFYVKTIQTYEEIELLLAKDISNLCHLLIKVSDDFDIEEDDGTKGISIDEIVLQNENNEQGRYIKISCIEYGHERDFLHYIAELTHNFEEDTQQDINVIALRTLESFEYTFAKKSTPLSIEKLIGLFGEVYILMKVLELRATLLDTWKGYQRFKWDFYNESISMAFEVKTARKTGIPICKISLLNQLKEPENGELYLIYIPLSKEYPPGPSFKEIIDRIKLTSSNPLRFEEILKNFGVDPGNENTYKLLEPYHIREDDLKIYKIDNNFPRIIDDSFKEALPASIFKVSYSIDLLNLNPDFTNISDFMSTLQKFADVEE